MNTIKSDESVVIRVKEAAPLLGVAEKTLIKAIKRGDIQGVRLSGLYFVSRAAIERLAGGTSESTS